MQTAPGAVAAAPALAKPNIRASVRAAKKDQVISFTGKAPSSASVLVQYAVGRNWRTLPARAKASNRGNYRIAVKHPINGRVAYRVAATFAKRSTFSSSVVVSAPPVARWYWLANYKPSAASAVSTANAASELAGQTYQYFIGSSWLGSNSFRTYRLNGTCSRITAFAGTPAWGDHIKGKHFLQVLGDGRQLFGAEFGSSEGRAVESGLQGVQRLTLATTDRDGGSEYVGFGAAQVLRTAPPGEFDPVD
ncbi:NPCBM/NEW2 domain-containing protein [Agilicoccus flavus]|uniref:NPCBM/NEW2 domain-containing protein n=1 Tax=Agilicoccus flavus TaxID=2775968 RepID=UPI001CF61CCF|nr:NPCBM/NEW2 domain-containing protein [Agilicoccus flavus]